MSLNKAIIIVYHENCLDGVGSAWVLTKALCIEDAAANSDIIYLGYEHSKIEVSEDIIRGSITADTILYFVDVAPEIEFLNELISADKNGSAKIKEIYILDHHESSAKRLENYSIKNFYKGVPKLDVQINREQSSATNMIWNIFLNKKEKPDIIKLIDKMDTVTGLKTSQDFAAAAYVDSHYLSDINEAFKHLRNLEKLSFDDMADKGIEIVKLQEQKIAELLKTVEYTNIQILPNTVSLDVPIVNANVRDFGRLVSSNLIALGKENGSNLTFSWSEKKTGAVTMSMRSDGNIDLIKVVEHFCNTLGVKGGGHKNCAAVHFSSVVEFNKYIDIKAKSNN